MRSLLKKLATVFGVGNIRKAPGTWGTVAAIPLVILLAQAGPLIYMIVTILFTPLAIFSADVYEQDKGVHDLPEVVIDEVLGFMITMVWLPMTWQSLLIGFALFRLFDIWKPWPISYMDEKIPGGLGVVIDDMAAGIVASLIMQYLYTHTSILGVQMIIVGG